MFQDEGRFGLLGKPRRCWAPAGVRPVVGARLLRKFSYAFAAVSPHDGVMDSLILPWVNAHTMSMFLSTVSQRHPDEYIVMVMDQAGWHIAQELEVPQNIRLVLLPPYSPEINPAEHIWDALREDCIGNTVFASLEAADKALSKGLRSLESDHERMQSRGLAVKNDEFRWVLYTAKHCQLVLMALKPKEEIGAEVHKLDQFFRVEEGSGEAVLDGVRTVIRAGFAVVVPAGTNHNIINTGSVPLKLYTLYAPPNHRDGVVHHTRADAQADNEHFDGKTTE